MGGGMNPLRNLRPVDCTPDLFQAACESLGFGLEGDLTTTAVDRATMYRWVRAGARGVGVRPATLTDEFWVVLLDGRERVEFSTLGEALDYALMRVAERTRRGVHRA
jgi:hypothetical protein